MSIETNLLKDSKWNRNREEMPEYSIIQTVIERNPDFDNLPLLTKKIEKRLTNESERIIEYLRMLS